MTKDYENALDVGIRLSKQNPNDVDLARALNILKNKEYKGYERSSLTESNCGKSDATDCDNTDFIGNNTDININLSKIASPDVSRLNNDAKTHFDIKQKMHRVIPIKMSKKFTEAMNLAKR
ncbi:hypothetical protein PUN28_004681 [Cardiocondyla obscurior]